MISFKLSTKFIKFCIVGTIGFLTEALIIHLVKVLYPDFLLYVRFISFPAALAVTWLLNRVFVFESGNSKIKEVSKYALVQTFGAVLNIMVYTLLLLLSDFFVGYPVLALAAGSAVALFSNYYLSKYWVF